MVPSPCIKVCKLNDEQTCIGCGRTIDEIARWSRMTDREQIRVWARLRSVHNLPSVPTLEESTQPFSLPIADTDS